MPYYEGFPFRFGPGPCCCPALCWFFYDDFNDRPYVGTTDLGANWHEEVGDWGSIGWVLVEKWGGGGTSEAVLICTQPEPAASAGEQRISVDVYQPQTGDIFYLYPCCTSIHDHGSLRVKYECTSAPSYWTVSCGGEVAYYTDISLDDYGFCQLVACADAEIGMLKAWVNYGGSGRQLWNDSASVGTGRYSGLGHDNTGHYNTFDNYFVGELRLPSGYVCWDCFCRCEDYAPGKDLNATIVDATGRFACLGGETCALTWQGDIAPVNAYWEGTFSGVGSPNGRAWSRTIRLACLQENPTDPTWWPGKNFRLNNYNPANCCVMNPALCISATPLYTSTCSPNFILTFGPYQSTDYLGDLGCWLCYDPGTYPDVLNGHYYIQVHV